MMWSLLGDVCHRLRWSGLAHGFYAAAAKRSYRRLVSQRMQSYGFYCIACDGYWVAPSIPVLQTIITHHECLVEEE